MQKQKKKDIKSQNHGEMHRYVTTLSASMEKQPAVPICMVYYSSTRKSRPRVLKKLYLRFGNSVMSIRHSSRSPMHRMFRDTLIALLICHKFCYTNVSVRSPFFQNTRLSALCAIHLKKLRKYSFVRLLTMLYSSMSNQPLQMFRYGSRINVYYTPRFRDLTVSLILTELTYIERLNATKK